MTYLKINVKKRTEMTIEDKRFTDMMDSSVKLKDKCDYLPLPFIMDYCKMPDDRKMAEPHSNL